jgi:NAD(P)-dependent dehydrogenase (short-subunit alcohol dehydrogenase family)
MNLTTAVLITGGASGIGKACAEALARQGRPIIIWDIDSQAAAASAKQIQQGFNVDTSSYGIDISQFNQFESALTASRMGQHSIGGLVHAAGVDGSVALDDLTPESWQRIMDINLGALPFLTQLLLPELAANAGSAIVGIASINAYLGNQANLSYSASKSGMLGLVKALADRLANDNIRINAVSPGQIDTPMLAGPMAYMEGLREQFERRILMGRLGQASEVANAVAFLLSDQASYITASELVVDGGNLSSQR